ncbi:MAG: hypothetical protein IPF50_06265 [Proteobacteria bacterium]|nr:hypothetical protein [Pseudomonadota bacterium]
MTGTGLPAYLTRQFALTRPQLATELGAELLSLCQAVTTDGRLAPEEAAARRPRRRQIVCPGTCRCCGRGLQPHRRAALLVCFFWQR